LRPIKYRLQSNNLYKLLYKVTNSRKNTTPLDRRVILLKPEKTSQGNVLLSFINEPFLLTPDQAGVYGQHTHYWASLEIAKTFLDLGYCVDVIRWNNNKFMPQKDYSFFIDARLNLERIGPLLRKDCIKMMYIETAHWLFHMSAQYRRLLALQQRKGITLSPHKTVSPNWGIEHADCATILGNEFTISTYSYANKPLHCVPAISPVVCPWPEEKDFEACRKRFLWFGSGGLVHKGLDLVLDAFTEMPEYHLTVCGPIEQEKDFEQAFYHELYRTPNIHTVGWVDASSPQFLEITKHCVGMIYPSCSEGQSGGVATCLHAGLIPIISYESGMNVDGFGFILKNCSIENIKDSVRMVASLSAQELKERARCAWDFARANHTREKFVEEFRKVVARIMSTYGMEGE